MPRKYNRQTRDTKSLRAVCGAIDNHYRTPSEIAKRAGCRQSTTRSIIYGKLVKLGLLEKSEQAKKSRWHNKVITFRAKKELAPWLEQVTSNTPKEEAPQKMKQNDALALMGKRVQT